MTEELLIRHEFYVAGGLSFTPDERRFRNPLASTAEDWTVEWGEGEERMFLSRTWHDLEHHQTAVLLRDGKLLILSAARLPVIVSTFDDVTATVALARMSDFYVERLPAEVEQTGVIRVSGTLEEADWLASVELMGSDWVGRARHGLPTPTLISGFGISDPVLVDPRYETTELPLVGALLPSTDLSGRGGVGVYFETYGLHQHENVKIAVSAERTDRSFIGRLLGSLGFSSTAPVSLSWTEAAQSDGMMPRHITLDLSGLAPGSYRIGITVERANGDSASSTRHVVIRQTP
jgi:hypothetical protein